MTFKIGLALVGLAALAMLAMRVLHFGNIHDDSFFFVLLVFFVGLLGAFLVAISVCIFVIERIGEFLRDRREWPPS